MESSNKSKYNLKEALKKDAVRFTVVMLAAFVMAFNINSFVNAGGLYPGRRAGSGKAG